MEKKIAQLVGNLQDMNDKFAKSQKIVHQLEDEIIGKNVTIASLNERIKELLSKIKDMENLVKTLNLEIEEKEHLIHSLQQ